jgi:hypothetical protein
MRNDRAPVSIAIMLGITVCSGPVSGKDMEEPGQTRAISEHASAGDAVDSPEVTSINLETMEKAEYEKFFPAVSRCSFSYSRSAGPVLVSSIVNAEAIGLVKIHGKLVKTKARGSHSMEDLSTGATFTAEGLRVRVIPDRSDSFERHEGRIQRKADAVFTLEEGHEVGYRGWYTCDEEHSINDND